MCLNLIKIRNRSISYGYDNFQPYYYQFPCGKCAECLELARSQWYLRNYWQCKFVFDQTDGYNYILFDTLTYRDEDLPHLSDRLPEMKNTEMDYPCFSFEDIRNFMKRLRINLVRKGFDVKNNLKYFLCSEYGTTEGFTHRPHYHVLFYITHSNIGPLDMSREVSKAWQKGRTDGVEYQGEKYVLEKNVFGKNYSKNTDENLRRVSCYVAKYVTKDSEFQCVIDDRIEKVCCQLYFGANFGEKDTYMKNYKLVRRLCSQFHRQSQGFGMYALEMNHYDIDELCETGMMKMVDKEKHIKEIPIPVYYSRKLFSQQVTGKDGRRFWVPTELGKKTRKVRTYKNISRTARRLDSWYFNLQDEDKHFVDDIMEGRDFTDFATYIVCYRGRIIPKNYVMSDKVPEIEEIIDSFNLFDPISEENKYYAVDGIYYKENDEYKLVEFKEFEKNFVIDQYFGDCRFQGFDELMVFYEQSIKPKNFEIQKAFDEKELLRKRYKDLGIKVKK